MKRWYVLPVAITGLVLMFAAPGQAFFELGKTLKFKCFDEPNSHDRAFCLGYISGIADAMKEGNKINNFKACLPDDVSDDQIWHAVTKILKDNPQNLHYTADDLVAYAYQETFPCK